MGCKSEVLLKTRSRGSTTGKQIFTCSVKGMQGITGRGEETWMGVNEGTQHGQITSHCSLLDRCSVSWKQISFLYKCSDSSKPYSSIVPLPPKIAGQAVDLNLRMTQAQVSFCRKILCAYDKQYMGVLTYKAMLGFQFIYMALTQEKKTCYWLCRNSCFVRFC